MPLGALLGCLFVLALPAVIKLVPEGLIFGRVTGDKRPRHRPPRRVLIDSSGVIRWINLTDDLRVRARPEQMLQAAKSL